MDEDRARELLRAERARVERLLKDARASEQTDQPDEQEVGDESTRPRRSGPKGSMRHSRPTWPTGWRRSTAPRSG